MALIAPRNKQSNETASTPAAAETKPAVTIPQKTAETKPAEPVKAEAPVAAPAAQEPAAAALPATQQGGTVATRPVAKKVRNAIEETFKNKMQLEWNTLPRIQANQGNFLDLDLNKAVIGNGLVVQLMSYQPNWQISPGTDDPDDAQYVRYSDDGITTTKGDPCAEFVAALIKAGYDKAKMTARYTMAFVIEEVIGQPASPYVNKIVQIDLSQSSKNAFDQFMLTNSFKESRGLITEEVAESGRLRLNCTVKNQQRISWTVVNFDNAL